MVGSKGLSHVARNMASPKVLLNGFYDLYDGGSNVAAKCACHLGIYGQGEGVEKMEHHLLTDS